MSRDVEDTVPVMEKTHTLNKLKQNQEAKRRE
jgi:hypothetical protein